LRAITNKWAKISYIFSLETEAAKNELNAFTAQQNGNDSRKLAKQLAKEATVLDAEVDAIQANIEKVEAEEAKRAQTEKYQKLSEQEQYEDQRASQQEKNAAVTMMDEKRAAANEKRDLAKKETENVSNCEQVSQVLRGRANDSRTFADKIRQL
jgi:hypothetical protein